MLEHKRKLCEEETLVSSEVSETSFHLASTKNEDTVLVFCFFKNNMYTSQKIRKIRKTVMKIPHHFIYLQVITIHILGRFHRVLFVFLCY